LIEFGPNSGRFFAAKEKKRSIGSAMAKFLVGLDGAIGNSATSRESRASELM